MTTEAPPHPEQPIERLADKSLRYRRNEIVVGLYAVKHQTEEQLRALFSKEDWEQLRQLLGGSVEPPANPAFRKRHPVQPIVWDGNVVRFKRNNLVSHLLDSSSFDLNFWCRRVRCYGENSKADYEQLMQLIGYSVSGAADIPEVSNRVLNIAQAQVDAMVAERDKKEESNG